MLRKLTVMFAFVFLAFGLLAPSALAAVSFDPATGTGFVGKGDVQLAFGWSNKQLQTNAAGVTFNYTQVDTYDVVCEWTTVTGGKKSKTIFHYADAVTTSSVNSSINGDPRQTKGQNQFTGFNLIGIGSTTVIGAEPAIGDSCAGMLDDEGEEVNPDAVLIEVALTSSTGGLYVNHGGTSLLLQ